MELWALLMWWFDDHWFWSSLLSPSFAWAWAAYHGEYLRATVTLLWALFARISFVDQVRCRAR